MLKKIGYVSILLILSLMASGATIESVKALMLTPDSQDTLENHLTTNNDDKSTTSLRLENRALLATPEWQQLSPSPDPDDGAPAARYNHAIAYHQASNTIFIFGGQAGGSYFNDLWALDLESLTWDRLYANNGNCTANTTCPRQRRTPIMTADNAGQNLYMATGQASSGTNYRDIWEFNLSSNTWQKLSSATEPGIRYGAAGGKFGSNLLLSHGFGASSPPRYNDTWLFNVSSGEWQNITPSGTLPVGRCLLDGVAAGDKFVIHGGQSGPVDTDSYRADTWILDTVAETWTQVTTNDSDGEGIDKPDGRRFQSLAYGQSENGVLLFGGVGNGSNLFNDVWLLDLSTNTWQELSPTGTPPAARRSHAAEWVEATISIGAGMLVFGGSTSGGTMSDLWLLAYEPAISANPGTLQFNNSAYQIIETATTATITVTRTGGVSGTVTVDYQTSDGTATAGQDYTALNDTLTFNDSETTMTITVPITDDNETEGDESLTLTLENPTGGSSLGTSVTATLTIIDSDTAGSLQFDQSDYSVTEGDGLTEITVTRTGGVSGTVTVDYQTSDGTATAGQDYATTTGTLTFDDGNLGSMTVSVPITDDAEAEENETFSLTLSNPTAGATVGVPATAAVTITDNDTDETFIYLPLILKNFSGDDDDGGEHDADLGLGEIFLED